MVASKGFLRRRRNAPVESRFPVSQGDGLEIMEGVVMNHSTLQNIAICGIGQMGAAAAVSFRRAGYRVLLWTRDPGKLAAVEPTLDSLETWMDEHVGPAPSEAGTTELIDELPVVDQRADLVMDCIAEDMAQKVALFRRMTNCLSRGSIFITTTSGLSITQLGRQSGTGHLLVGTHFWNPPHLMPLVEVIRGDDTPPGLMDRVCDLVESIGKIPVRVNQDVPGFIGNRLLHALWREAIHLVERGIASPADIDRVVRLTFGLRLSAVGPLENMDLVGLDLVKNIHDYLLADLADNHQSSKLLEEMVGRHESGIKNGQGFYDWTKRDGTTLIERRDRQIVNQINYLKELDTP